MDQGGQGRQSRASTGPAAVAIQGWSLTSLQQRLFKTGGRLIRHARYFTLQLAEREPLAADALSADSRAHRATRVASDVTERPPQGGEQGRRPAARVSPRRVVTGGRPSANTGSVALRPQGRGVSSMRMGGRGGEDVTSPLARLYRGSRWIHIGNPRSNMKTTAFILTMLLSAVASAQQTPSTGYAPVNGLKMYYEVHGSGDPVVLLHGAFMTITNNWPGWIGELSKSRKVIAVELQGHGRTADVEREFSYENLADDVAAVLDHLKSPRADLIGYSMGGGVAMQCAIRHPEKVRKVVSISAVFRHDGLVNEALDAFPQLAAETFKGSPIESEYKKLSPTPNDFPKFVKRVIAMVLKPYDFGPDKLKATKAPMLFMHGDADGVRLDHISEMFRLKVDEIHGDRRRRPASRLAILPNTTHITLMERMPVIVPMVNDFLDTRPQTQ